MKNPDSQISTYRIRLTFATAISALIFLPPFAVNNLLAGRTLVGMLSLFVVAILALHAWLIYRGRYFGVITVAALVPAVVVFLAVSIRQQQIIGALWCYPAVVAFFSLLPRGQAAAATGVLLAVAAPLSIITFDDAIAARVVVTLLAISIFTFIFVTVIESQRRRLALQQIQLRDSMASASHELRTPLTAIAAQIHAMRDGVHPADERHLGSLLDSVTHLNGLVDDLFLLASADTNELPIDKQPLRLGNVIDDSIESMGKRIGRRNLSVQTHLDESLVVPGDPRRVRQIVDNLLENCARYTEGGGTIHVSLVRDSARALLEVRDSGPGVDDATLSALFDRYFRADRSRSRTLGGTGLGLAVVKALAEAHGGSAIAFHAPEGGLGIRVLLPTHS